MDEFDDEGKLYLAERVSIARMLYYTVAGWLRIQIPALVPR